MNTFNIKAYIAQVAENVLSAQPDYDFQLTEVSGIAGLEGIVSGQVAYDNFIATDSTDDGYVYQQPNGGYFMRRVATVFIMRKYQYMDMAAMREEVEKCRRYFNLIVAQMVADQSNLETKLIYLNAERIVIREFEPETSAHFTGLYFMLEFSQPYSLVAAPPVPKQYIRGHITTGARTISFKINSNQCIEVEVDEQGNWQWIVDRQIASMNGAFEGYNTIELDKIELINIDITDVSFNMAFAQRGDVNTLYPMRTLDMSQCKGSITVSPNYIMYRNRTLWLMPNIDNWQGSSVMQGYSRVIATGFINTNINVSNTPYLELTDVLSIINHASANVTYTLNISTYICCQQGGIWHAQIQAALDAKAAEGFTVTLISA